MANLRLLGEPEGGGPHTHPEADIEDGSILARLAANETVSGLWEFGQDIKMAANKGLQDSSGLQRLIVAASSPHVSIPNDLDVGGHAAIGAGVGVASGVILNVGETNSDASLLAYTPLNFLATYDGASAFFVAMLGMAFEARYASATNVLQQITGVRSQIDQRGGGTIPILNAIEARTVSSAAGSGAITRSEVLHVQTPIWTGAVPATHRGIYMRDQGRDAPALVEAIRVEDILAGTTRYILELGPSTPYMRLVAGSNPAANQTNLYLMEQNTLRRVEWVDPGNNGGNLTAGQRVMVLV